MRRKKSEPDDSSEPVDRAQVFERIKVVRAEAIHHYAIAQERHAERKVLIRQLIDDGLSQADIGRELGVSRQAIQKMLSL